MAPDQRCQAAASYALRSPPRIGDAGSCHKPAREPGTSGAAAATAAHDAAAPTPAINDVVVEVHVSGFVPAEWEWPSTWVDRSGHDRAPAIIGHEFAGVVTALGYGTTGL